MGIRNAKDFLMSFQKAVTRAGREDIKKDQE
jgi:hypothetical protein